MRIRTGVTTPMQRELFDFGATTATTAGADRCAQMAADNMALAVVDARDPRGAGLLSWHFETHRGFDSSEATEQVQLVISQHERMIEIKSTSDTRPLKAFWVPDDMARALVRAGNLRLRQSEVWTLVALDHRALRCPVDFFAG